MELALEWLESQRAVMFDPTMASYFLQYPNGTIYNEPIAQGAQFFWDFRNTDAAQYFISSIAAVLASDPAVDGTFTDDVTGVSPFLFSPSILLPCLPCPNSSLSSRRPAGVPEEHPAVQANINMTNAELASLQWATQAASSALIETLVAQGKYNWQAFGAEDGVQGGPSAGSCAAWMAARCGAAMQGRPLTVQMDNSPANANQTIAAFLIARPPYAYVGWGWESDDAEWNDLFYLQAGEPLGLCAEPAPGVFERAWSGGVAQLDCNKWEATLPFPTLNGVRL